jgi:hypothetical protein
MPRQVLRLKPEGKGRMYIKGKGILYRPSICERRLDLVGTSANHDSNEQDPTTERAG